MKKTAYRLCCCDHGADDCRQAIRAFSLFSKGNRRSCNRPKSRRTRARRRRWSRTCPHRVLSLRLLSRDSIKMPRATRKYLGNKYPKKFGVEMTILSEELSHRLQGVERAACISPRICLDEHYTP